METPNLDEHCFASLDLERLRPAERLNHPPRILLLHGSLRKRSFSRLANREAARILTRLGAETRSFEPTGLPLPDDAEATHPKVVELRELVSWCEGMVWCSPERHGAMTGIMKAQIDW
ncbi:MAG: NAD(P)H-dependent oxidoreductase, partial [Xanthomonadales bacterium]|nr:NAD(P)H-dependent oxidoreductase [Xanthomonadales bacterium]